MIENKKHSEICHPSKPVKLSRDWKNLRKAIRAHNMSTEECAARMRVAFNYLTVVNVGCGDPGTEVKAATPQPHLQQRCKEIIKRQLQKTSRLLSGLPDGAKK